VIYKIYTQEKLDEVLSSSEKSLKFSRIELYPWKGRYRLDKIPCGHITFMRPSNLNLPSPTIELESIYCPEWVNFFGVNLIGGILNLSEYNQISSCYLTEIAIDKGTFFQSFFDEGRLNVMTRQKYELLGGKTLPFFVNCVLRNCFVEEANIYFDFGQFNLLLNAIISRGTPILQKRQKYYLMQNGNILIKKEARQ